MKYLLLDGNNLACRCSFANAELKNKEGVFTGVHYGFFQSLINIKQKFPNYTYLISWDSKSIRRVNESTDGVQKGIIPEVYKENRKKEEMPQPLKDFYEQAPYLQRAIEQLGIQQIKLDGFETDDVIASYCTILKGSVEDIVIVTSDRDYYQILDEKVSIYDGMKGNLITLDSWQKENGIIPEQYVHVGAMMGDDGDNIFGVPGWGEKTSLKEIKKYGSWEKILEAYKIKYQNERIKYPDLNTISEGANIFTQLKEAKSEKGKTIYPEISFNMPYTGVLNAFDKDFIKASKTEIMALLFEERIGLAFSLKKMDSNIPNLPEINVGSYNQERLDEYFDYYDITTLGNSIKIFQ
jgi:5'-3' exonuclease